MQVIKPIALGLQTRCIEHRRRLGLAVTALIFFPFRPQGQGAIWKEPSLWDFLGTQMPQGPLIDEGAPKGLPEYLVGGWVFAPGGRAQACEASMAVGPLGKRVQAVGARQWVGGRPSEPAFFDRVPLDWSQAYGGAGFARNPLGMGHAPVKTADGQTAHWLPQLILPGQHPGRPDDEVEPAGLGAIDLTWPQRMQYAGTYDDRWFREQSPGLANDLDWRFFNMAPQDQWFPGPLSGTEAFAFENMHPNKPRVEGVLPGVRPRCFVREKAAPAEQLREVNLALSTLWFFPHAEVGVQLWKGLTACQEDDGTDIGLLYGGIERIDAPRPVEHYAQALALRLQAESGPLYMMRESDLMPEGMDTHDPMMDEAIKAFQPPGLRAEALRRGAQLTLDAETERAIARGVDPALLKPTTIPEPEPLPSLDELPDYILRKQAEALDAQVNAALDAIEQMMEARRRMAELGIDPESVVHRGPPVLNTAAEIKRIEAVAREHPEAFPKGVGDLVTGLVKSEAVTREGYLASAHTQPPAHRLTAEQSAGIRDRLQRAVAADASGLGANLTGADLSGMKLDGADLIGAWLESVNLSGSQLKGALLPAAVLAHADLSGADLSEADLAGANLGLSTLKGTRFVKANLVGANFSNTDLAEVDLRGARIDSIRLLESRFGRSDWRSTEGSGLLFMKAKLAGMVMHRCRWIQPTFIECDLTDADFAAAELDRPTFVKCKGLGTRFLGAKIDGAIFAEACDFSGADFSQAMMNGANLRGASLKGARFVQARLDGADLSTAACDEADFTEASLKKALMIKTSLCNGRLTRANLLDALLQRADLRGCDLTQANLYGADLSRIKATVSTQLQGANLDRARTHPRWQPPATA